MDGLRASGLSDEEILALQLAIETSTFPPKEKALLMLARHLTADPATSTSLTVSATAAGWSHEEVAQAIFLVSYFNMVTRIAQAFDLPPDARHPFDPEAPLPMLRCEPD